jgi:hypothetical protein
MFAATQAEPIPGYVLVERLGQGGFGEVWRAEAPGGLRKAIKVVHGSLNDGPGNTAAQELKALNRIKAIHHPYILGLERVDIVDNQIFIVMELADRNLMERLRECQRGGLKGIPRAELLRYLAEAAEALDLMNNEFQLQHLDIKPQNLFLVQNHIKVADFGLVKDLDGMTASLSAGLTPTYASPETFDGKVTRYSDQYSLAIVYQEMLTGQRPFNGSNARVLLMQHVTAPPDLSLLPGGDQAVVARALAKDPRARFPTCMDFVNALRKGSAGPESSVPNLAVPAATATLALAAGGEHPAAARSEAGYRPLPASSDIGLEVHDDVLDRTVSLGRPASSRQVAPAAAAHEADPLMENLEGATWHDLPTKATTIRPPQEPASETASCPGCGTPLTVSGSMRWCTKCSFVSGLAPTTQSQPASPGGFDATRDGILVMLWREVPNWQKVLIGGMAGISLLTVVADLLLPPRAQPRVLWSLWQLLAAVIGLVAAHIWAMRLAVARTNGALTLGDVLRVPRTVWIATFRNLPATSWPVWLTGWGFSLAVSALVLGAPYFWSRPPAQQARTEDELRRAIEASRQKQHAIDELAPDTRQRPAAPDARQRPAGPADWPEAPTLAREPVIPGKPLDPNRELGQVVIAGYIPDAEDPTKVTVVLAAPRDGKLVYAGTTSQGFTAEERQELSDRLKSLKRATPPDDWKAPVPADTVWVELDAKLQSVVEHAGSNPDGTFKDTTFRRFLK